ncbi:MAG: hypothetical protein E4H36_05655 [Spirochaetales bacterium]|nr:MAG: hypothetical protein E4H36_05655 [Spirochaetales bacterium]
MDHKRQTIFFILLFLLAGFPVFSIDVAEIQVFGGLYWQGSADQGGAPSPLLSVWGAEVPINLTPLISLNPSLSFPTPQDYTLTSAGLAVPTEIETADAVTVLQLTLDAKLAFNFNLTRQLVLSPFFSPAFIFYIPTFGYGRGKAGYTDPVSGETVTFRSDLMTSMYSFFRSFRPSVGGNFVWRFGDSLGFYSCLAAYFPVFHAWDDLQIPFYDQFLITLRLGISIYLK